MVYSSLFVVHCGAEAVIMSVNFHGLALPCLVTVLYCTVLYCTVLYCTVLYCTVLYCTVLLVVNQFLNRVTHRQIFIRMPSYPSGQTTAIQLSVFFN